MNKLWRNKEYENFVNFQRQEGKTCQPISGFYSLPFYRVFLHKNTIFLRHLTEKNVQKTYSLERIRKKNENEEKKNKLNTAGVWSLFFTTLIFSFPTKVDTNIFKTICFSSRNSPAKKLSAAFSVKNLIKILQMRKK